MTNPAPPDPKRPALRAWLGKRLGKRLGLGRMRIVALRAEHAQPAHALFHRAVHIGAARCYSQRERAAWAPSPQMPDSWPDKLCQPYAFGALRRGRLAGFFVMGGDGHLDLAYVDPDWMGRGVAGALYDRVIAAAAADGVDTFSTEASHLARRFLLRRNWKVIARQNVIRNGTAITNFRMEYLLKKAKQSRSVD